MKRILKLTICLPLLQTQEGREGRGEEEIGCPGRPSLQLSPHSSLVGRESSIPAGGFMRSETTFDVG